MLELGEALIPILAGYWILTRLHYTHYSIVRDSGYHLFFKAAIVGTFLYFVAHLIVVLSGNFLSSMAITWSIHSISPFSATPTTVALMGFLSPFAGNWFYNKERAARRAAESGGDLVELLIADSIETQKLIELSLKSRKSYIGIGIVSGIETIDKDKADIELLPLASGYRDKHTQELIIIENYAEVLVEHTYERYDDFCIVIPMSEIVSARIFDPDAYALFQEMKEFS